jgi:hypothetical protein
MRPNDTTEGLPNLNQNASLGGRKLVARPRSTPTPDRDETIVLPPRNAPEGSARFQFVDGLSRARGRRQALLQSFVQTECHRKRKRDAIARLRNVKLPRAESPSSDFGGACPFCGAPWSTDNPQEKHQCDAYFEGTDLDARQEEDALVRLEKDAFPDPVSLLGASRADPFATLACGAGVDVFLDSCGSSSFFHFVYVI